MRRTGTDSPDMHMDEGGAYYQWVILMLPESLMQQEWGMMTQHLCLHVETPCFLLEW